MIFSMFLLGLTHGTINLRTERVMVSSILIAAVETAQPLFRMRQQTLRTDLGEANVRIEADPLRLCQVFGNILANAAKYSPEHAVITIDLEELGDEVIVRINDPGVGIAPEDLPRIFDVFVQGDHSRDLYDGQVPPSFRERHLKSAWLEPEADQPGPRRQKRTPRPP